MVGIQHVNKIQEYCEKNRDNIELPECLGASREGDHMKSYDLGWDEYHGVVS